MTKKEAVMTVCGLKFPQKTGQNIKVILRLELTRKYIIAEEIQNKM